MKPTLVLLALALSLTACDNRDAAHQQRLKDWSSTIENRVAALETRPLPGRFQLVSGTFDADGDRKPTVLKIDTATGQVWQQRSITMTFPTKDGTTSKHLLEGWWPVKNISEERENAERFAKEFQTSPVPRPQ